MKPEYPDIEYSDEALPPAGRHTGLTNAIRNCPIGSSFEWSVYGSSRQTVYACAFAIKAKVSIRGDQAWRIL
jgi:hypothetical protein